RAAILCAGGGNAPGCARGCAEDQSQRYTPREKAPISKAAHAMVRVFIMPGKSGENKRVLPLCSGRRDSASTDGSENRATRACWRGLIERESHFAPCGQTSSQRPDALHALPSQKQRHTGAGSFAGSTAIEDDVAVPGNCVRVFREVFRNQMQSAWNHIGVGFEVDGVAQIDNRDFMALVQHLLQLFG